MGDVVAVETLPIPNALSYEALLAEADEHFTFPEDLDENTPAGMCYKCNDGHAKGSSLYTSQYCTP